MITDDQRDELIFDYLEGNLNAEEEEVFRILNDESELFNREVRLWQNTYISEPLPSIEALENNLLIAGKNNTRNTIVSRIGIALILLFVNTTPDTGNSSVSLAGRLKNSAQVAIPGEREEPKNAITTECQPELRTAKKTQSLASLSDDARELSFTPSSGSVLKLDFIIEVPKPGVGNLPTEALTIPISVGKAERKKWTRRENRLIRKKRWRADELRRQSEFLKGKVPYVVPLDSNNF